MSPGRSPAVEPRPRQRPSPFGQVALVAGLLLLVVAVVGSLTGLFRSLLYDPASGQSKVSATSSPLDYNAVIDANLKHIRDSVGTPQQATSYRGHLAAIDTLSTGIGGVARSTAEMTANVHALRGGLGLVLVRSRAIDRGLVRLDRSARAASVQLRGVAGQSDAIATLMGVLRGATGGLAGSVSAIDGTAGAIAGGQLPAALTATRRIDGLLPGGVPPVRRVK